MQCKPYYQQLTEANTLRYQFMHTIEGVESFDIYNNVNSSLSCKQLFV